ncbi:MAG: hypothetical protein HRU41_29495 [Saprospiraceae bacterium]|nr:hypothetical protein [Saprospiraceae bacterium]
MILLICGLIVAPILWILFTPIVLQIDTLRGLYWVHWRGIASLQFNIQDDEPILSLRVWFWKKDFRPLDSLSKPRKQSAEKRTKKRKPRRKINWRRLGLRLIRSFIVRQFDLKIDTDDYILNSYLYPVFHLLNSKHLQLGINYQGESSLQLHIENRLIRLLKAILL